MAFKRSVSTYFTNQKCFTDFDALATARGVTHSKFIMNLIEKALYNGVNSHPRPSFLEKDAFAPAFTKHTRLILTQKHSHFIFEQQGKDKIEVKKRIFERVDLGIRDALIYQITTMKSPQNYKKNIAIVMLKQGLDISYSLKQGENGSSWVTCIFSCDVSFFELTDAIWYQCGGRYDLTNVKYHKYEDIQKKPDAKQHFSLFKELQPSPDKVGVFLIPIIPSEAKYPPVINEEIFSFNDIRECVSSDKPQGIYLYMTGVNIYSNAERVKFSQFYIVDKGVNISTRTRIKTLNKNWRK